LSTPPLSAAKVRALEAVRDRMVWQRFNAKGNTFDSPKGATAQTLRVLQKRGLIEVPPAARSAPRLRVIPNN
jgi:hypothetical protein